MRTPSPISALTSKTLHLRYPSYFGENQLSPGSIGISPLPTPHPRTFPTCVGSGLHSVLPELHPGHGRSPGFRSLRPLLTPYSDSRSAAAPRFSLTSHGIVTRRFVYKRHGHHPLTALTIVGNVSGSLSLPFGVLFTLSSRTGSLSID